MKQAFMELVVPRLEELRADLRRVAEKLDAHRPPLGHISTGQIPPLSCEGQAYRGALVAETREGTGCRAREWAERRAKDPKLRVWPEESIRRKKEREP